MVAQLNAKLCQTNFNYMIIIISKRWGSQIFQMVLIYTEHVLLHCHVHTTCIFLTPRVYINYAFFLWGWIPDYTLKDDAWVCQYDRCSLNSDLEFWVISQDKAQIWWVALSFSGSPDKYRTSGTKGEQPRQTPRYFHKNHCSSLSPKTRRCSISLSRDAMTVRCWLKEYVLL